MDWEKYDKALSEVLKNNDLYVKILRIGQTFVDTGISYNQLKSILIKEGYDFSCDCMDVAVKQWFFDSFHHKGADGKLINVEEMDNHLDCRFILRGDASMKLFAHQTAEINLKIARKAMIIAIIAALISIFQQPIARLVNTIFKSSDEEAEISKSLTINPTSLSVTTNKDTIVNIYHYYYHYDSLRLRK